MVNAEEIEQLALEIKQCQAALLALGVPRASLTARLQEGGTNNA